MNRINIVVYSLCILLLCECQNKSEQGCSLFYKSYPNVIAGQKDHPDTTLMVNALNEIIAIDSSCVDARLTRGDILLSLGDAKKAKVDYKKAIEKESRNVYALYKLGILFQDEAIYDSSIYFLSDAIGVKTKGDFVMDLNHINKTLEIKEEKYDVAAGTLLYTRGISFYYARDLQKALHDFNFCIRNNYRLGSCYFYRGAIFEEVNLKDSACEDFRKSKFYGNADVDEYISKYCK